jgi:amino acid adenylation domain-containing protein
VAALGVLKVGAVCMSLEPSHPRARHQKLLDLTKPHALLCSTALAEGAHGLAPLVFSVSAETVSASAELRDQPEDNDESEQNAYMIFTSGSTGTPKGVVLQHRALATSLTSAGRYVGWHHRLKALQFTSYIWDASIGEIFGTLIFGGCVCIPSAETRESGLADYINVVGVEWIFQTPAGMSNLSPHEIPTVKTLLTGGDRVQPESAMTWGSKLRLINAWGPCESSIYATFAELDPQARFPETIGRPVGCAVWIADPTNSDRLVPIGAVGELIIESTTVAKGYFENESATAAAFIDSPTWAPRRSPVLTKARRFYRTGDLGKYNDDGTIYFIGRRDHQVKINGQRLELGELEDVISQCSAVRAVAVVSHAPRGRHELVAILTIDDPQLPRKGVLEEHSDEHHNIVAESVDSARSFTAAKLPSYMLPAQWLVVRDLPRAASSKVDRQAIGRWLKTKEPLLSGTPDANDSQTRSVSPPVSAAEQTLRSIWSNVLDVPEDQIGRDSSFLRLSGDSITAMQVCTRLRRLGLQLSVQTLMQLATLSATAAECKEIPASAPHKVENHATGSKKTSLSPIQELFMRNDGPASHNQFNQSWLLQLNTGASDAEIKAALQRIVDMHPMLRAQFSQASAGHWEQSIAGASTESSWRFKSHSTSSSEDIRHIVNITQSSLDIKEGSVFAADLISAHSERLLFLAAHHLVCDIVSWRVILEDFENILTSPDELAEPTTSFTTWVEHETRAAASRSSLQQRPPRSADIGYWDIRHISLKVVDTVQERFSLEEKVTALLMGDPCNAPFATRPAELMLAATLSAFQEVFPDRDSPAVYSEGHGRGTRNDSLARTVGWFTTMYPVPVELRSRTPDHAVIATKDAYRSAQNVKWFRDQQSSCHPLQRTDLELLFNFAGHLPQANARDKMLNWRDPQDYGIRLQNIADEVEQIGLLSVFCFVQDRRLRFCIDYNKKMAHQTRIQQWIKAVERTLCQFADELPGRAPKLTVADVSSLNSVGDVDIDAVNSQLGELQIPIPSVETIYPCSAVQEGILFAQLKGQGDEYRDRFALRVTPTNPHATVSVQDLEQAWRSVCRAHPILRTVFTSGLDDATAFQQIVLRETEPMVKHKTLDGDLDILSFLQAYRKPTIPETMPPHCMTVVQNAADCSTHVVFDASHAIIDARSMHIMAMQLISAYQNPSPLPRGPSYSDYIVWTESRRKVSRQYWTSHLADQEPCLLPSKAVPRDDRPASLHFDVPFNKASALNSFCRQHGVTIASFAQVVWALVLKRHSVGAAHSPCFGCIHSGRDSIDAADRIMGPMISMLISRFDITSPSSTSPLDLMNQARQDSAEGSDKAGCSLGEIHEQLGLGTSLLFNTIMSIQPAWVEDLALKGSAVSMAFVQADDPTEVSA